MFSFLFKSIRRKLLLSVSVILGSGIGAVLYLSTRMHLETSEAHIRKDAADTANGFRSILSQLVQQSEDRARSWALNRVAGGTLKSVLASDSTIRGVEVLRVDDGGFELREFNDAWKVDSNPDELKAALGRTSEDSPHSYEVVKTQDGKIVHRILSPLVKDNAGHTKMALVFYMDPAVFKSTMASDSVSHIVVYKRTGEVLFQSMGVGASDLLNKGQAPDGLLKVFSTPQTNLQSEISSNRGEMFVGSLHKVGVADLAVAVLTSEVHIFEQPRKTAIQSGYLGLAILLLAFAFVIMFSDSLVRPVKVLVEATKRLGAGDFSVRSTVKTRDEISVLSKSFNEMAMGLQERERIKDIFGKFHSKAVVEKLFKEEKIRLGGERIPVTVFFSDIRGFTSASEVMSPEAVVEMLNEYMTEMVSVIELHEGVVDKYVGDAIMAVWGMAEANPQKDAVNAVTACLRMRDKLAELNKVRAQRNQPPLKIGMGLNSGDVVAGNIGSHSRMEYTVIGDTVNTASRMESATKAFDTDFLLHESTAKLLPDGMFRLQGPFEASAKGKSESIQVFKVLGFAEKTLKKAA